MSGNTLPDLKFAALRAQNLIPGGGGAIPEMTLAWLKSNGATSDSIPDAWAEMLSTQFTSGGWADQYTGHRADDWYKLLELLGYATAGGREINHINERERLFWGNGGTFGPSAPIWGSIPLIFAYESGIDAVINLNNYCFAKPDVTGYTADVGTLTGGPPAHILTITWADLGSTPGQTTVNLTATNPEGTTPWAFQVEAVAGAPQSKPQWADVPDLYGTEGETGGYYLPGTGDIPAPSVSLLVDGEGVDMNQWITNKDESPVTGWSVSATAQFAIDPVTGILTLRPDAAPGQYGVSVTATNEHGSSASNVFQVYVLESDVRRYTFDTVAGGTQVFRILPPTTRNVVDGLEVLRTVPEGDIPHVGQLWSGSEWTESGVGYGQQLEDVATNHIIYSEDLSQAAWVKSGSPIIASTVPAPDGTNTATTLSLSGSGVKDIKIDCGVIPSDGEVSSPDGMGLSFYAAIPPGAAAGTIKVINFYGAGFGEWTIDTSKLHNGLQYIYDRHPAVTEVQQFIRDGSQQAGVHFYSTGTDIQLTVWGIQLERGTVDAVGVNHRGQLASSYIKTAGTAVTRDPWHIRQDPLGYSISDLFPVVNDYTLGISFMAPYSTGSLEANNNDTYFRLTDNTSSNGVLLKKDSAGNPDNLTVTGQTADGSTTADIIFNDLGIVAGDLVRVFVRKQSSEAVLGDGLKAFIQINGGAWIEQTASIDMSGNHELAITKLIIGKTANLLLNEFYFCPRAMDDSEIKALPPWSHPVPIITSQPQDVNFGGDPPQPTGVIFETDFSQDAGFHFHSGDKTQMLTGFDIITLTTSGSYPQSAYIKQLPTGGPGGTPCIECRYQPRWVDAIGGTSMPGGGQPVLTLRKHLTKDLTKGYNDLYIRMHIKFSDTWNIHDAAKAEGSGGWKWGRCWQNEHPTNIHGENRPDSYWFYPSFGGANQKFIVNCAANEGPNMKSGSVTGQQYLTEYADAATPADRPDTPNHFEAIGGGAGSASPMAMGWDTGDPANYKKFINNPQDWHTIEIHYRLSTTDVVGSEDGTVEYFFDGVSQGEPISMNPNAPGNPLPPDGYTKVPTTVNGSGFNFLALFDNVTQDYFNRWVYDEIEAGNYNTSFYIANVVIATGRIGHGYEVSGTTDNVGTMEPQVTIATDPMITAHPYPLNVASGATDLWFSGAGNASDIAVCTYEWQWSADGSTGWTSAVAQLSDASESATPTDSNTNWELTLASVAVGDTGYVRLKMTSPTNGDAYSKIAQLTVT